MGAPEMVISPLNFKINVLPIGEKKGKVFEESSDCEVVGVKPATDKVIIIY
jgi:hypothetical protein